MSFGDLLGKLAVMLMCSPKFEDPTGGGQHWTNRDVRFYTLNEGLLNLRGQLGDELYRKLATMSDESRACFEADPEEVTGETRKGQALLYEMEDLIRAKRDLVQARKLTSQAARARAKPRSSKS
jgi:hypothetical protein